MQDQDQPIAATEETRILAMDIGDSFVGLAMTSGLAGLVEPLFTLRRTRLKDDAKNLARLVRKHRATTVIAGLPRNMDGSEGPQAQVAREFVAAVEQALGFSIVLVDERLTTREAHERLNQSGYGTRDRKQVLDQVAAVILLESYLAEMQYRAARNTPPA